jgi:hypothetical protein
MACSECLPTRLNPPAERTCFSQAWARLRLADVARHIDAEIAAVTAALPSDETGGTPLVACAFALPGDITTLCAAAGLRDGEGVCEQGSLWPRCAPVSRADRCGCTAGFGWSNGAQSCVIGASTSHAEGEACTAPDSPDTSTSTSTAGTTSPETAGACAAEVAGLNAACPKPAAGETSPERCSHSDVTLYIMYR